MKHTTTTLTKKIALLIFAINPSITSAALTPNIQIPIITMDKEIFPKNALVQNSSKRKFSTIKIKCKKYDDEEIICMFFEANIVLLRKSNEIEQNTCKIFMHDDEYKFRYNSQSNQWIHTSSPFGACGNILIHTLELESDATLPGDWKYTVKDIYTKNEDDKLCGYLKDSHETYNNAYAIRGTPFLNCKYID